MLGLIVILLIDSLACQELSSFVGEHVAVMVDEIVLIWSVLKGDILQEILVNLLWDLGLAYHDFLNGLAEGCGLGWISTDASAEVIFLAEDDKGGVVDGVDLLSDHHHAHAPRHSHGDIIDIEGNRMGHLF